jgi:hypothetical protein
MDDKVKSFEQYISENFDSSLNIEITNIDEEQKNIICEMLYLLEYLGNLGHSAEVSIYADGDGAFRPKIRINGEGLNNVEAQLSSITDIEKDKFRFDTD